MHSTKVRVLMEFELMKGCFKMISWCCSRIKCLFSVKSSTDQVQPPRVVRWTAVAAARRHWISEASRPIRALEVAGNRDPPCLHEMRSIILIQLLNATNALRQLGSWTTLNEDEEHEIRPPGWLEGEDVERRSVAAVDWDAVKAN